MKEELSKEVSVELSVGHLLVIWNVLSNKLSGLNFNEEFTDEEKRALWALEDICEKSLIKNKITTMPEDEWDELIQKALKHVKALPVEFLD